MSRLWTADEEELLLEYVDHHHGLDYISARLGRGRWGVRLRMTTLGVSLSGAETGAHSFRSTAAYLGLMRNALLRWVRRGWVKRYKVSRGLHMIDDDEVLRFLEDPDHWHDWRPERIQDADLRAWALELRRGVEFLTVPEAAERLGIANSTAEGWIREGKLRAVQSGNGWRYVRNDWLALAPVPGVRCANPTRRAFSDDEVRFLITWRPVQPISDLAAALDRAEGSIDEKCKVLGLTGPKHDVMANLLVGRRAYLRKKAS